VRKVEKKNLRAVTSLPETILKLVLLFQFKMEEGRKKSLNSKAFSLIKMHEAELCFEKCNY